MTKATQKLLNENYEYTKQWFNIGIDAGWDFKIAHSYIGRGRDFVVQLYYLHKINDEEYLVEMHRIDALI